VFFQILPPDFKRAEHGDGRLIGSQAPINEFRSDTGDSGRPALRRRPELNVIVK